jgi:hypothetical protein
MRSIEPAVETFNRLLNGRDKYPSKTNNDPLCDMAVKVTAGTRAGTTNGPQDSVPGETVRLLSHTTISWTLKDSNDTEYGSMYTPTNAPTSGPPKNSCLLTVSGITSNVTGVIGFGSVGITRKHPFLLEGYSFTLIHGLKYQMNGYGYT